jgi:hypothetical protein
VATWGNNTPVDGYVEGFTGVADRRQQMAAYDALPVTVLRALDNALFAICCVATLKFYRAHGASKTIAEIEDSNRCFMEAIGNSWQTPLKIGNSSLCTTTARRGSGAPMQARRRLNLDRLAPMIPTVAAL